MTASGLLLALVALAAAPGSPARTVQSGGGSDLAPATDGLRHDLRTAGQVAAASGGLLMGAGLSALGYYGVVLHEEVRVGLTREQTEQGQSWRVVTDLEAYRARQGEALLVWNAGWYSLATGLVVALLGTGLSLSPQLFLPEAAE